MLRWIPCLGVLLAVACGDEPTEPDVGTPADEGGGPSGELQPLDEVPHKPVGNPVAVGLGPFSMKPLQELVGLETTVATSLAFVDYDDDGWPDLVTASDQGLSVFRNHGGTFVDDSNQILPFDGDLRQDASITAWGDVDGDGDLDCYVGYRRFADRLLLNDGQGHLVVPDFDPGLPEALHVQGVTFVDVDGDADLDLYVTRGRRIDADDAATPAPGFEGAPNHLLLNDGTGRFTDATTAWNAAAGDTSETFGALFADFDRDGDPDAFVVRDFEPDHWLQNAGGTHFEDRSTELLNIEATTAMGVTVGDFDGDGGLDIYTTDNGSDRLYLWRNGGLEASFSTRLQGADPTAVLTGWGCSFIDLDQDGDQDVVSVAGYQGKTAGLPDPARLGGFVVFENDKGKLVDRTEEAGLPDVVDGYALATADFDRDGDLDFAVALRPPAALGFGPDPATVPSGIMLIRNESARAAGNHFLQVSLRAETGNRFAVGAIVDVTANGARSSRVLTAGDSYLAAHNPVLHFGLGDSPSAEVTITWPWGPTTRAHAVPRGAHRLAPHNGDCCFPGADCGEPWVECPRWHPLGPACAGSDECDVCALVCARLDDCGAPEPGCQGQCAQGPPSTQEAACVLESECAALEACFPNGADGDE